jgi:hypothetical protein
MPVLNNGFAMTMPPVPGSGVENLDLGTSSKD